MVIFEEVAKFSHYMEISVQIRPGTEIARIICGRNRIVKFKPSMIAPDAYLNSNEVESVVKEMKRIENLEKV